MSPENFFIKSGYKTNPVITADSSPDNTYWNRKRIASSNYYQFPVYRCALDLLNENSFRTCLDVGCGAATKLKWLHSKLPNIEFCGIDQPAAIRYCTDNYDFGKWYVDDFENPDQSQLANKGDLVICADVIEHLGNPTFLLEYLKLVVKPRGLILLSTPERDLYRGKDNMQATNKHHVREWNSDELRQYLEHSGLSVVDHFLQYPVRFGPSMIFYREIIARRLRSQPVKYNQVWLLRPE